MALREMTIRPIGKVRSRLTSRDEAPRQGTEGAPDAWLELNEKVLGGLDGLVVGQEIIVLTWLHQARREVLKVHPRSDPTLPLSGVFATRSPDRPNPVGLHRVRILELARNRIKVRPLEAIDGTPIVDIKPVLPVMDD
jgi:tRNA-Thr(GGU) m(6)t(6)A37 methyltransferase TsaA